jgi:hypothetical protein
MLKCFAVSIQEHFAFLVFLQLMPTTEHVGEVACSNFAKNASFSSYVMRSADIELYQLFIYLGQFVYPGFLLFPFQLFVRHLLELCGVCFFSFNFILDYRSGFLLS